MKHLLSLIFILVFAFVFASAAKAECSVTLSTDRIDAPFFGTYGDQPRFVDVTTTPNGCQWTATTSANWIAFNSNTFQPERTIGFNGNARLQIYAYYNEGNPRTATITINDKILTVEQGSGCEFTLRDVNSVRNAISEGETLKYPFVNNTITGTCAITYTTESSWIKLNAANFTVAQSEGIARTGTIIYHYGNNKTLTLTVNQAAGCFYSLDKTSADFSATGGANSFVVYTGSFCSWTAEPNQEWITVNKSGTGDDVVTFSIAPNTGAARSGIINTGGQTFTVNQSAAKTRKRVRVF